jgi:streptogramin lyase
LFNPTDGSNKPFKLPADGVITGLTIDNNGNPWVSVDQANKILKFEPKTEKFSSYDVPTANAEPRELMTDSQGTLWYSESATGKIANINATSGKITEYAPKTKSQALGEPTSILEDPKNPETLYISEHTNHTVTAFNKLLGTFHRYPSPNESGAPFGMAMDKNGNLWIAEHLIDRIAVMDPRTGESKEAKVPISGALVQYLFADNSGKIWFAAQRDQPGLSSITTTAKPSTEPSTNGGEQPGNVGGVQQLGFSFAQVAGPGIAAGIVLSALVYAKTTMDLRRNMRAALRLKS